MWPQTEYLSFELLVGPFGFSIFVMESFQYFIIARSLDNENNQWLQPYCHLFGHIKGEFRYF